MPAWDAHVARRTITPSSRLHMILADLCCHARFCWRHAWHFAASTSIGAVPTAEHADTMVVSALYLPIGRSLDVSVTKLGELSMWRGIITVGLPLCLPVSRTSEALGISDFCILRKKLNAVSAVSCCICSS